MIAGTSEIPAELAELVRQIVFQTNPLQVILFGSAVREGSIPMDWDLLIVMPEGTHRRRTAQSLYAHIQGIRFPFDLVVATPEDLERYGRSPGLIYHDILLEGRTLYAA